MLSSDDTIVAVATAVGRGVRGIVRATGPDCEEILRRCLNDPGRLPPERVASAFAAAVRLRDCPQPLPGTVYFWPTARSYTRQPSVEFHTLGSPPLLEAVVETFCAHGARLAGPGEFTLRAFLAGRLDLPQAEAVLGVIDAQDDRQLKVALTQLAGGLSRPLHALRDELLRLLAHLEAGLDFVEEDIEFISSAQLSADLQRIQARLESLQAQLRGRTWEGQQHPRVVLWGRPNVGKSSLLNALTDQPLALVSAVAGTTRDYVTATLDLGTLTCELWDTAGLHLSDDPLEEAAQQVARRGAEQAQLRLLCLDAQRPPDSWERAQLEHLARDSAMVAVVTRCDLPAGWQPPAEAVCTSSRSGSGIEALRQRLRDWFAESLATHSDAVVGTAVRCGTSLQQVAQAVARAADLAAAHTGEELVAAELRWALDELGQVVGVIYTDDLLDQIFSRFCIGK